MIMVTWNLVKIRWLELIKCLIGAYHESWSSIAKSGKGMSLIFFSNNNSLVILIFITARAKPYIKWNPNFLEHIQFTILLSYIMKISMYFFTIPCNDENLAKYWKNINK